MVEPTGESGIPSDLLRTRPTRNGGSILMAAMLGLVQALGWENNREQTLEIAEADLDAGIGFTFGDLPPLE